MNTVTSLTSKIVSKNIMTSAHLHMDTLLEGEVMDICTKEMDNLRVSDLEDTVVEDPEPGSGKTTYRLRGIRNYMFTQN